MIISACSFVLLNVRRGNRPTHELSRVVLALLASTLSLSSSLHSDHARSTNGRIIMACWMLASLSLVTYTRSLLTASLTAKPTWYADDTLDEVLPKLRDGRLLPCVERNSFFDFTLASATGNGSDVMDVMAFATRQWARGKSDFTGSSESCLKRTRNGTHAFFSDDIDLCTFLRFQKTVSQGQKPVHTLIGGFPVRRDY
ncbi:hypothetical protein HPB49_007284 [Dermacentor silvarum]|uniref:Uncharacterized protein n=1 Tax=Dermacentor silvarum TaxID=543639 RepID=A0ACB8CQL3_DERSI|nr:hypothetical protein HPB49_007284 [Dermacentor silvarum]